MQEILRTSSKSDPNKVAGAIAGVLKESESVEIQAVGAGAVNQTVKAVAIARGFLAPIGISLMCTVAFVGLEIGGEVKTAIKFIVSGM